MQFYYRIHHTNNHHRAKVCLLLFLRSLHSFSTPFYTNPLLFQSIAFYILLCCTILCVTCVYLIYLLLASDQIKQPVEAYNEKWKLKTISYDDLHLGMLTMLQLLQLKFVKSCWNLSLFQKKIGENLLNLIAIWYKIEEKCLEIFDYFWNALQFFHKIFWLVFSYLLQSIFLLFKICFFFVFFFFKIFAYTRITYYIVTKHITQNWSWIFRRACQFCYSTTTTQSVESILHVRQMEQSKIPVVALRFGLHSFCRVVRYRLWWSFVTMHTNTLSLAKSERYFIFIHLYHTMLIHTCACVHKIFAILHWSECSSNISYVWRVLRENSVNIRLLDTIFDKLMV